jgi:hypothetical protein
MHERVVGHRCSLCKTVYWGLGSKKKADDCFSRGIPEHILVVGQSYWDRKHPAAFRIIAYQIKKLGGMFGGHTLYVLYAPAVELLPKNGNGSIVSAGSQDGCVLKMSETQFKEKYPFALN